MAKINLEKAAKTVIGVEKNPFGIGPSKGKKTQSKASRWTNQAYRESRKGSRPTNIRTNQMYEQAGQGLNQLSPQQQALAAQQQESVLRKQGLEKNLQDVIAGNAPSLAQAQLKQATDKNLAQQLAASNRARGGNIAMSMRSQQQAQASSGRDLAQQGAILRAQEINDARSQLGGLTSSSEQMLSQSQLQREALLRQQQENATKIRLQADMQKQQNMQAAAQGVAGYKLGTTAAEQGQQQINQEEKGGYMKAGGQVLSAIMSDKQLKTNIKKESNTEVDQEDKKYNLAKSIGESDYFPKAKKVKINDYIGLSDKELKKDINSKFDSKDFLSKIGAYSYKYKPEANEDSKTHFSTMAQDLENAGPIGRSMVENGPEGKMVNYGHGFGAILASQVQLNERLKALEEKKKKS